RLLNLNLMNLKFHLAKLKINKHSMFLKVTNLDGQTQYQTVYEGDDLYGRKLYNGSGQWHKYTNTPI
ncbi:hypothetical protein, partial [Lactobacillus paragasseri]|uniref:hypothetical protein n=1 Tax=Lactobacillus paragasseri TaxID=2107999 RepID=UPI003B94BEAC